MIKIAFIQCFELNAPILHPIQISTLFISYLSLAFYSKKKIKSNFGITYLHLFRLEIFLLEHM